jgi:hypothetical protein
MTKEAKAQLIDNSKIRDHTLPFWDNDFYLKAWAIASFSH